MWIVVCKGVFSFFLKEGWIISSRASAGVRVKDFFSHKIGGVKRNFGGVEHFIRPRG